MQTTFNKRKRGKLMNKGFIAFFIVLFMIAATPILKGEDKRVYNDGIIDYVPLSASFVLEASDSESFLKTIQYSIDGSPLSEYKDPLTISTEGRHVIVYRAIDRAGNISNERIYSVIVDGTPPEGLVSVEGPVYMKGGNYYLTGESVIAIWAEDNLSGVDTVWVKIDDRDYIAYKGPLVITEEGFHTAMTYAVDNVGNSSTVYKVSGYVDNTPPEVKILNRDPFVTVGNENYTNRDNEFSVTASDEISGVRDIFVSLDGSDWFIYSSPFKIQGPGFHTLRARASDNLGNESSSVEITFHVDVAPPETTLGTSVGP
jgi:hypothetical protein